MQLQWRRSFFSGFAGITLLFGIVGAYLYRMPIEQMQQGQWVVHTHEVLSQLEVLSDELTRAGSLQASYAPTPAHISEEYKQRVDNVQHSLADIVRSTQDNASQQERLRQLSPLISGQFASQEGPQAQKDELAAINSLIETIRTEENRLLEERLLNWHATAQKTQFFFMASALVLYLFLLASYRLATRESYARDRLLKLESETANLHKTIAARMTHIMEVQQHIVNQRLDLPKAMQAITERTQEITRANGAVIEMLDGDEMVYRAASGTMMPFIELRLKAVGSLSGLCVTSNTTLRCEDSELDPRVDKAACRKVGLRSMIVVPLMQADEPVGVLKVTSSKADAFTEEDVSTLQLMAGVLSTTLRDAIASDELKVRANSDGMTDLKNHRFFQEHLLQECYRAERYDNQLSLIMLDVDHFKAYNDQFGHPAGDAVLKRIALLLKEHSRPSDCVARYGGEEFAIILPQTSLAGAENLAERIREGFSKAKWPYRDITASMGISSFGPESFTPDVLIDRADKALYMSKANGRDRFTSFEA